MPPAAGSSIAPPHGLLVGGSQRNLFVRGAQHQNCLYPSLQIRVGGA